MIAMQYRFTLPADYDMAIIRRRIAERGHLTDAFPHLAFKAYLYAERSDHRPGQENRYAPFYLWHQAEGMHAFLGSRGFAALTQAFGWPSIQPWVVWDAARGGDAHQAAFATCEEADIASHSDLAALRDDEQRQSRTDLAAGALVAVNAYDPARWRRVRVRLWRQLPDTVADTSQHYRVGHVSCGATESPLPILPTF